MSCGKNQFKSCSRTKTQINNSYVDISLMTTVELISDLSTGLCEYARTFPCGHKETFTSVQKCYNNRELKIVFNVFQHA